MMIHHIKISVMLLQCCEESKRLRKYFQCCSFPLRCFWLENCAFSDSLAKIPGIFMDR